MNQNQKFQYLKDPDVFKNDALKHQNSIPLFDQMLNQSSNRSGIYMQSIFLTDQSGKILNDDSFTMSYQQTEPNTTITENQQGEKFSKFWETTTSKTIFDCDKKLKINKKKNNNKTKPVILQSAANKKNGKEEFSSDEENFYKKEKLTELRSIQTVPIVFGIPKVIVETRSSKKSEIPLKNQLVLKEFIEKMKNRNKNNRVYQCEYCDKYFDNCAGLGGHQSKHHRDLCVKKKLEKKKTTK